MADHTKAITWRDLEVWQRAHVLVLKIYRLTAAFPQEEKFRLADQLCRAAISVPANIVEGQARQTTKEYLQFLYHARGSVEGNALSSVPGKGARVLRLCKVR